MAAVLTELRREAVSLDEGSKIIGLHPETLRRAIKTGRLRAFKTSANGHYRIWLDDLRSFMIHPVNVIKTEEKIETIESKEPAM